LECLSLNATVVRASQPLSRKPGHVGALAFSRSSDASTGEFTDATVIRKFGDVSEERVVTKRIACAVRTTPHSARIRM